MELAQDWRLYLALTRGKKARSARVAERNVPPVLSGAGALTAVISSGAGDEARAQILALRGENAASHEWVGRSLSELKSHLGESRTLQVIRSADLRSTFQIAEKSGGLFEQRRVLRDSLNRLNPAGKGRVGIPPCEEKNHFLLGAFSRGALKRLFPRNFILWVRFHEGAAVGGGAGFRDDIIGFRDGAVVGCGAADLSSLGPDRLSQEGVVARHLSDKYVCPVQGLVVSAADWDAWVDADRPWKEMAQALRAGRLKLEPAPLAFKAWIRWKALF